ncbi:MAG: hypothetical protein KJ620_10500 [Candidatus Edwardsbacteria bacterium]|nr:hypothetical protein [Candidatus Edwardsbacteria bacterium]MBU1576563.1 hypothetical protein [Candidatus Edwardsbacteria bacterium]MBU2594762.1 hypothetical protein [Candidatus Edwardsbacteria bacterium]
MRVKCKYNRGYQIKGIRAEGEEDEAVYDLSIGKEYDVFGMDLADGIVCLLVCDDYSLPNWYSTACFDILDDKIPDWWYYRDFFTEPDILVKASWGYKELIKDNEHHDALLEREPDALAIFKRYVDELGK